MGAQPARTGPVSLRRTQKVLYRFLSVCRLKNIPAISITLLPSDTPRTDRARESTDTECYVWNLLLLVSITLDGIGMR